MPTSPSQINISPAPVNETILNTGRPPKISATAMSPSASGPHLKRAHFEHGTTPEDLGHLLCRPPLPVLTVETTVPGRFSGDYASGSSFSGVQLDSITLRAERPVPPRTPLRTVRPSAPPTAQVRVHGSSCARVGRLGGAPSLEAPTGRGRSGRARRRDPSPLRTAEGASPRAPLRTAEGASPRAPLRTADGASPRAPLRTADGASPRAPLRTVRPSAPPRAQVRVRPSAPPRAQVRVRPSEPCAPPLPREPPNAASCANA